ncbi:hypothetical protein FSP39_018156, partial [Pinctada imbricata]
GFWIGIDDIEEENTFVDTLGNTITYNNFDGATSQPNGGAAQNCVGVFPEESFTWQDKACTDTVSGALLFKHRIINLTSSRFYVYSVDRLCYDQTDEKQDIFDSIFLY